MEKTKMRIFILLVFLVLVAAVYAASTKNTKDTLWVNTTYYTINESYNLILYRLYGPFPLETVSIIPNQTDLPAGMTMPVRIQPPSLAGYANTTGNWTPSFCQGGVSYRFKICYNHSANPFTGCADTEYINITVRNKNRAPYFDKEAMFPCGPARINLMENHQMAMPIIAKDLDKIECSNEIHTIALGCSVSPKINDQNDCTLASINNFSWNDGGITGLGQINWTPGIADIGQTYTFNLSAYDQNQTTNMQFQVCVNSLQGNGAYITEGPCRQIACY